MEDGQLKKKMTSPKLAFLLWLAASVFAQPPPEFEVATIKLAAPDAVRNRVMPSSPDRLSIPSMTLTWLIYTAYRVERFGLKIRQETRTGAPVHRSSWRSEKNGD